MNFSNSSDAFMQWKIFFFFDQVNHVNDKQLMFIYGTELQKYYFILLTVF